LDENRESCTQLNVVADSRYEEVLADCCCGLLEFLQLTIARQKVRIQQNTDKWDAPHEFV
jgi:hypothetical protein